jgi:uncharacterized membrane protein
MKRWLGLVLGGALCAFVSIAPSLAQDGYVMVTICNQSPFDANVAIQFPTHPGSQQARVKGWYRVYAQSCNDIGTFPAGQVDIYADTADSATTWDGLSSPNNVRTCLRFSGAFDRVNYGGYTCAPDEELKVMASFFVGPGRWTNTLR